MLGGASHYLFTFNTSTLAAFGGLLLITFLSVYSALPAIPMGFLDSPERALAVGLTYVGIQFLENHILIPLLMKGGMNLPPALTVLAQALLALVFGFLGLMVAVPLLATIMVIVQLLYVQRIADDAPHRPSSHDPELDEALQHDAVVVAR